MENLDPEDITKGIVVVLLIFLTGAVCWGLLTRKSTLDLKVIKEAIETVVKSIGSNR